MSPLANDVGIFQTVKSSFIISNELKFNFQVHAIGPEGGMVSSTVVPQVQAVFPQGALTKKIKVGLQVNLFKPRKNHTGPMKKISVNNIPKKKRFSLIW